MSVSRSACGRALLPSRSRPIYIPRVRDYFAAKSSIPAEPESSSNCTDASPPLEAHTLNRILFLSYVFILRSLTWAGAEEPALEVRADTTLDSSKTYGPIVIKASNVTID